MCLLESAAVNALRRREEMDEAQLSRGGRNEPRAYATLERAMEPKVFSWDATVVQSLYLLLRLEGRQAHMRSSPCAGPDTETSVASLTGS